MKLPTTVENQHDLHTELQKLDIFKIIRLLFYKIEIVVIVFTKFLSILFFFMETMQM